ncbi:MAG: hypothetical protein IJ005_03545 [Bacteroidales bacterium]|nr:hypothetical protein [Bacteroidales bacterium]
MEHLDLKELDLDSLTGLINLYPWYAGARKELCLRMKHMGYDMGSSSYFADAAMYMPSRRRIADLLRDDADVDWTDADVEKLLKSYISAEAESSSEKGQRRVHVVGGDYFSQAEYDKVRRADDNVFSRYAAKARRESSYVEPDEAEQEFYTETLAQIYLEQGYPEQAKHIYSKLILANPEKNAYFAALIEKIDELNQYR